MRYPRKETDCWENSHFSALQVMLQQSTKHPAHQGHMLGVCSGVYQNVIDIHLYILPVQVPENLIYKGLED